MKPPFSNQLKLQLTVATVAGLFSSFQRLMIFSSAEWLLVGYVFTYTFVFTLLLWWLGNWLNRHVSRWLNVGLMYLIGLPVMLLATYGASQWLPPDINPFLLLISDQRLQALQRTNQTVEWLLRAQAIRSVALTTAVVLVQYALHLFTEKQRIELENEFLKQENLNAQLEAIRQQINPHFFFNTLNTLKTLVKTNQPDALPYISQLSNVFRYLLQLQKQDWVTLQAECQFLDSYLFLLQIRFGQGLQVDMRLPDPRLTAYLPPASLQLLVENAVKHNVTAVSRPLRIVIGQLDRHRVYVENNLQPRRTSEPSSQFGLHGLNRRYTCLCGQGIQIEKTAETFRVVLPVLDKLP